LLSGTDARVHGPSDLGFRGICAKGGIRGEGKISQKAGSNSPAATSLGLRRFVPSRGHSVAHFRVAFLAAGSCGPPRTSRIAYSAGNEGSLDHRPVPGDAEPREARGGTEGRLQPKSSIGSVANYRASRRECSGCVGTPRADCPRGPIPRARIAAPIARSRPWRAHRREGPASNESWLMASSDVAASIFEDLTYVAIELD
jgi:hypothetical protein